MSPQDKPLRQVSWQADVPERDSMDVDVLVLGARDFRRLLDEVPSLSGKILVTLARRVRELTKAV